jgi:CRISPR-associated protein Cas2
MRHRYLVAYDVSDPQRLRRIYKKMLGYGDPIQYSVFCCDLSDVERTLMKEAVGEIMNMSADRLMIADLGPVDGRAASAIEFLGTTWLSLPDGGAVIV